MQSLNVINGACYNTTNCQPDCNEAVFFLKRNKYCLCGLTARTACLADH